MALAASAAFAQKPSIDEIMARVAVNQAKSVEARKQYVYRQNELVRMGRSNAKTECEQRREFTVAPTPNGSKRQLVQSVVIKGAATNCTIDTDSDLNGKSGETVSVGTGGAGESESFRFMGETRDGVPRGLFPLTAAEQRLYTYRLEGTETYRERQVYRIGFRPNHKRNSEGEEGIWKGQALVDAEELQPVQVITDLTGAVPLPVRILLGTDIRGLGFTVSYQRMADGVWFPAGYGGEFEMRALFFLKMTVSVNVTNSDFRRTDVTSKVAFEEP
jgi:hypothetical protein